MDTVFKKYITILLGIYAFWILGVPAIFSYLVPVVCENISYNSNYKIQIKNPKLKLSILPTIVIKASEIDFKDKGGSQNVYLQSPRVQIRILPLLSGNVHINRFSADYADVSSVIENMPALDKEFVSRISETKVKLDALNLKHAHLMIRESNASAPVIYTANNIYYRKNNRFIKINIDSQIKAGDKFSKLSGKLFLPKNNNVKKSIIDVDIVNFDIAPLGEFLKNYLPQDIKNVRGVINIDVDKDHLIATFKDCAVLSNDEAKSIVLPKELDINSEFNLSRKTIVVKNAKILSKNINTDLKGTISNYLDRAMPSINLNVIVNSAKVEDVISMLPPFKTEDIDVYKLKKYKFYGDAIANLNIKGDNLEPSINGEIFINNGVLTKPIPNTKGASVKLDFLGKYLNFDVFVPASISEKVWVKGGVELYNVKYSDMRVWSTPKVDLALAEEKVNPIHEILNFVIGPVPIMDIKGDGNIDITIKGNRKNPHVWGGLNFHNVTTNFNGIPDLILKNADAVLTFDDENVVFGLKQGEVNGQKFDINGTCNLAGKFDFDVKTDKQELNLLHKALLNSEGLVDEIKTMLPSVDAIEGPVNLQLKVYGNIKDIEKIKFKENFFAKGSIELLGNLFEKDGIKIHDTKGTTLFDGTSANIDITSMIGKSPLKALIAVNNNIADISLKIPKLNLKDAISSKDHLKNDYANIFVNVDAKYKGKIDSIEYDKINLFASVLSCDNKNKLHVSGGEINFKNNKLQISNLKGKIIDTLGSISLDMTVNNVSSKPIINGRLNLKDFDLTSINSISEFAFIPKDIRENMKKIFFDKGKINLNAQIKNNNVNASANLGGIAFTYVPLNMPIRVINGSMYSRNEYLALNKINIMADSMPILVDGRINNLLSKQDFSLYINSKPNQDFIDKYFNNNHIYPVKIKGDIVYTAKLNGVYDNFQVKATADIAKDSSLYYLGATIGDIENAILLNLDMSVVKQNILKIKEFSYDKLISSLGKRQTRLNMLKIYGGIDISDNDMIFHDLIVKTNNPTDARIFNFIFRKPNIKQGQFTSDIRMNGKLSNPKVLGNFHIFETNIPFLDTTMKNISLVFKDKYIDISSFGEVLGNEIKFKGVLRNKLTAPYYIENAQLITKELDLNYIVNKLKMSQVDDYQTLESFSGFDLSNLVIKDLKMKSEGIYLRNLAATNVEAQGSISENKLLNINKFKFNVAKGEIKGDFRYNISNSDTGITLNVANIDANDLTYAVFDMKNQLYGNLTGEMRLSCNGVDFNTCMETLNGKTNFNVSDGRMPKLGSLEYLLKAGNLFKGGVTNLTINGLIDLITPLKTGNFSDIFGFMEIKNGVAETCEISTKGKDLSLFISGTYNFADSTADMKVLGLLSKKISTMFGPVGNVSLNTLFNIIPGINLEKDSKILENINRIPGIELSSKAYRKFLAEIKGNINGDNYVTSFSWIN